MQQDSAPPTRHLRVHEDRGHTVLEFHGEIDIAAAVEIIPHLDAATGRPGARLVIDLSDVEFFDCSGLRLIYRARTGCSPTAAACSWSARTRSPCASSRSPV